MYNIKLISDIDIQMIIEDVLKQALNSLPKLNRDIDPKIIDIFYIAQTLKEFLIYSLMINISQKIKF
jgi:hypothetical protein